MATKPKPIWGHEFGLIYLVVLKKTLSGIKFHIKYKFYRSISYYTIIKVNMGH